MTMVDLVGTYDIVLESFDGTNYTTIASNKLIVTDVLVVTPVVGTEGFHSVESFGGQGGEAFLNKHEISWSWEPRFRWSFEMESYGELAEVGTGGETVGISSVFIMPALLVIGAASFAAGHIGKKGPRTLELPNVIVEEKHPKNNPGMLLLPLGVFHSSHS